MASADAKQTETAETESKLTAAQAARLVGRERVKTDRDGKPVIDKDGRPVTETVPVKASEIFDFRDHGGHVVVVTVDGQKLRGEKK